MTLKTRLNKLKDDVLRLCGMDHMLSRAKSPLVRPSVLGSGRFWKQTEAGVPISPELALTFSPVWCAVTAISTDIASLPFRVYRRTPQGGKVVDHDHLLSTLLECEVNADMSSFHWEQTLIAHALLYGNGYSEIRRDANGQLLALELMDPRTTRPRRTTGGHLYYETRDTNGRVINLLAENVLHLAGLGYDGIQGYSPIDLGSRALGLGIATETFGASFFGNSAVPSGILSSDGPLTDEALEELRDSLLEEHGGSFNANGVLHLPPGLKWTATTITPEHAQFLQTREFSVIEVCRIYNISPIRLQDYSKSTYSNVEQAAIDHVNICLRPWIENLESEVRRKLLSTQERKLYSCAHDLSARLRGDSASRTSYYRELFNIGVLSINDIRTAESFNRIDGGDEHYAPLNLAPVSSPTPTPEQTQTPKQTQPVEPTPTPAPTRSLVAHVEPTPKSEALEHSLRELIRASVAKLVRREVAGLRRKSSTPEAVYKGLARVAPQALGPSCRAWAELTGNDPSTAIVSALLAGEQELQGLDANDISTKLDSWEQGDARVHSITSLIQEPERVSNA